MSISPKQQFFIALRLVACAQNGLEVALKSLNLAVPPPKFVSVVSVFRRLLLFFLPLEGVFIQMLQPSKSQFCLFTSFLARHKQPPARRWVCRHSLGCQGEARASWAVFLGHLLLYSVSFVIS